MSAGWTSVASVWLTAMTGRILTSDGWFIDLANIAEELLPHGPVEAKASLQWWLNVGSSLC
jgi:hypothetical protein